jgi:ribose transport system substrate-binding protein
MQRHLTRAAIATACLAACVPVAACGENSDSSSSGGSGGSAKATPDRVLGATRGPHGEKPQPAEDITLTSAELEKVRKGNYTAALVWHTSDPVTAAMTRGAEAAFKEMNVEVVATTNADYQADRQSEQLRTVMAKKPDVILSLPVDPTATAEAYKAAADGGARLVFADNVPDGFEQGRDYVTLSSSDLFQMGKHCADALAKAIGDKGEIGYIYHDADFYVTNQRDQAFKKTIEGNYPGIKIVAEQGIADPAQAESEANAMLTKHPNLAGIYVTFGEVAQGVLPALRNVGATDTKLVTIDLQEPLALDMAQDGATAAIIVQGLYGDGQAMARAGALDLLGKKAPAFVVSQATTVTKDNLVEGYEQSERAEPPESVRKALGG